ncbi:hypothetical protein F4813DRAFT_392337 [Daldinia decipiens]|uniref:uncharacterized protein n=1 Tax=Daldinia decipiens TaxID=326647 RepID=UPI0020C3EAE1|nr:uncharacterized protein F4813DRAFT_392337 [Daldinia decipiens]KAI1654826.1 hypothetical protein F4813DRAFT_392337 [Daldinia decipiens]
MATWLPNSKAKPVMLRRGRKSTRSKGASRRFSCPFARVSPDSLHNCHKGGGFADTSRGTHLQHDNSLSPDIANELVTSKSSSGEYEFDPFINPISFLQGEAPIYQE